MTMLVAQVEWGERTDHWNRGFKDMRGKGVGLEVSQIELERKMVSCMMKSYWKRVVPSIL